MTHANSFARAAAPRTRSGKQHRQNSSLLRQASLRSEALKPHSAPQALTALTALRQEPTSGLLRFDRPIAPTPRCTDRRSATGPAGRGRAFRTTALLPALLLLALSRAVSASVPELSDATASGLSPEHEWGCKVLLCLADPRGPKTEPECRPPINRLYEELRSRHPHFPTCPMAGDGNYARALLDPFDPCSLAGDGLTDAPEGYVAEGRRVEVRPGRYRTEITKSPRMNTAGRDRGDDSSFATKACVKDPQGVYRWSEGWGDSEVDHTARLYGTVLWLEPQGSRAIDVFIDGTLWRRVRY